MKQAFKDYPPGSPEAVKSGCICPVLDNCNGKGINGLGELYWILSYCPIHGSPK